MPEAAQLTKDTVLIGPSERYDLELLGDNPGVWMFHCHMEHHIANGMMTLIQYEGVIPTGPVAEFFNPAGAPGASATGHQDHGGAEAPPPAEDPAPVATPEAAGNIAHRGRGRAGRSDGRGRDGRRPLRAELARDSGRDDSGLGQQAEATGTASPRSTAASNRRSSPTAKPSPFGSIRPASISTSANTTGCRG